MLSHFATSPGMQIEHTRRRDVEAASRVKRIFKRREKYTSYKRKRRRALVIHHPSSQIQSKKGACLHTEVGAFDHGD